MFSRMRENLLENIILGCGFDFSVIFQKVVQKGFIVTLF